MKKSIAILMIAALSLSIVACGSKEKESEPVQAKVQEEKASETAKTDEKTFENLTVDTEKKEISFEAVLNGTYFTEPTRHAIVGEKGGNADKAMFRAKAYNVDYHDALEELGLSGDSNVSMDDMSASVEDNIVNTGDGLEYFIKWDGQEEIPFKDVIKADKDFDWNVVFAGNREVAEAKQSGCFLCLDSCAAGVAVNALPVGTTAEGGTQFFANEEVLPEDGTTVTITVRPAK
ncbi:MAG: YdjY domain-containing protein [Muricomes sp.]